MTIENESNQFNFIYQAKKAKKVQKNSKVHKKQSETYPNSIKLMIVIKILNSIKKCYGQINKQQKNNFNKF